MTTPFVLPSQAATGFGNASHYDKHRPSYPAEAVEKLLKNVGVAGLNSARVVDLASGTGKFTELLAARPEKYEIVAVEPHEGMREELVRKDLGSMVKVLDGDAGNIPLEEGWGDALIAAQAFHWFAKEESLNEIHRVLKPGTALGMIWNAEDYNAPLSWKAGTKWEQELKDILNDLDDGLPRFRHLAWRQVFENQQATTPLGALKDTFTKHPPKFSLPVGEEGIKWTVWLSDEAVWARYTTLSHIANQHGEKREQIRRKVFEALKDPSTERNGKGEVAVHGVTYLAWTSRV